MKLQNPSNQVWVKWLSGKKLKAPMFVPWGLQLGVILSQPSEWAILYCGSDGEPE